MYNDVHPCVPLPHFCFSTGNCFDCVGVLNGSQIQRSQAILGRDYSSALQDPFYQHFFYLYSKHFQFFETTLNRTKLDMAVLGKRSFWLPQDGLTRTWKHNILFFWINAGSTLWNGARRCCAFTDIAAQAVHKSKVCFVFVCYGLWQHLYELCDWTCSSSVIANQVMFINLPNTTEKT